MNELTLFSLGFVIFATYMFFLLRMIWRQHKAQEENQRPMMKIERDENLTDRKAS